MKSLALLLAVAVSVSAAVTAPRPGTLLGDKKVKISAVPATAEIFVNGSKVANGATTITVKDNATVVVEVKNFGYISMDRTYINNKVNTIPGNDTYVLVKDPSIDGSTSTDIANKDVDVKTDLSEEDAWKLISQIVTSAFDVVEVTDRNSGYLRTAWTLKRFDPGSSVRTRLIVKMGNTKPLLYKVKLVSENAPAGTSPKDDEKWAEWDRVLRSYTSVIPEIQARLGKSGQ